MSRRVMASVGHEHSRELRGNGTGRDLSQVVSPKTELPLSRSLLLNCESFDFASDYHLPCNEQVVEAVIAALAARKQSDTFICVGDLFDAGDGEDRSAAISSFLTRLSRIYELVLYTPGNHCLRSREEPWASFHLPEHVIIPQGDTPKIVNTEKNKILLANVFYDLRFIDSESLGISRDELMEFYRIDTTDGKHLLGGSIDLFTSMADNAANTLTQDVTMLVTHTLPHPVGATFRVAAITEQHREIQARTGARFICDPEKDNKDAHTLNTTADAFRRYWNFKSLIMGSDIVNHPAANPRDGLICLYGHNHRSDDFEVQVRNGAAVGLRSHQPYGGDGGSAWERLVVKQQT
jgi:hypothetical protein